MNFMSDDRFARYAERQAQERMRGAPKQSIKMEMPEWMRVMRAEGDADRAAGRSITINDSDLQQVMDLEASTGVAPAKRAFGPTSGINEYRARRGISDEEILSGRVTPSQARSYMAEMEAAASAMASGPLRGEAPIDAAWEGTISDRVKELPQLRQTLDAVDQGMLSQQFPVYAKEQGQRYAVDKEDAWRREELRSTDDRYRGMNEAALARAKADETKAMAQFISDMIEQEAMDPSDPRLSAVFERMGLPSGPMPGPAKVDAPKSSGLMGWMKNSLELGGADAGYTEQDVIDGANKLRAKNPTLTPQEARNKARKLIEERLAGLR